jgi:hypothetical protein
MKDLYESWIVGTAGRDDNVIVEPPPDWLHSIKLVSRGVRMQHEKLGERFVHDPDEADALVRDGWQPRLTEVDFAEVVHLQAAYLQSRFFPRLRWHTLTPPANEFFILGDRPVVWGFADAVTLPPSAFRLPGVQLFAPLTRRLALFARHAEDARPDRILASEVNKVVDAAATRWIAGPTEHVVRQALTLRTTASGTNAR